MTTLLRRMTWPERVVGRATTRGLIWLSIRAAKRGDAHECNHCLAALLAGNSTHLPGGTSPTCGVPTDRILVPGDVVTVTRPPMAAADRAEG